MKRISAFASMPLFLVLTLGFSVETDTVVPMLDTGVAEACAEVAGSCKPKLDWDCIIDGIEKNNKCDDASPQC